jgi:thiol-disulfide isomerase/thioredoxin
MPSVSLPRSLAVALAATALAGVFLGGFGLGVLLRTPAAAPAAAAPASAPTSVSPSSTPPSPTAAGPFTVGTTFPRQAALLTLQGRPGALVFGPRATVILAMASWCLFCAYEDKYVIPALAQTPGVAIDVVDVSPQGGIGDPGPLSPPFSGHDGSGGPLTTAGMAAVMRQYVRTFGTLGGPRIHVFVARSATQAAWNIQSFPTLAYLNAQGQVVAAPPGAQTVSQATQSLQQALAGS